MATSAEQRAQGQESASVVSSGDELAVLPARVRPATTSEEEEAAAAALSGQSEVRAADVMVSPVGALQSSRRIE